MVSGGFYIEKGSGKSWLHMAFYRSHFMCDDEKAEAKQVWRDETLIVTISIDKSIFALEFVEMRKCAVQKEMY